MADKDFNDDEYQFSDMGSVDNPAAGEMESDDKSAKPSNAGPFVEKDNKRKIWIIFGVIFGLLLVYQVISLYFGKETPPAKVTITPVQPKPTPAPVVMPVQPVAPPPPVVTQADPEIKQKVLAIEASQESLKSDQNLLSQKVETVSASVTTLNEQIEKLNTLVNSLSTQVASQSNQIQVLTVRLQPKPVIKKTKKKLVEVITYAIRAVIPGRAWLIASNGSTLTVRRGTPIPGLGVVTSIDAVQGRVATSSGKVIRFSQDDS
jgi:intracellular multiplication protein IcmG